MASITPRDCFGRQGYFFEAVRAVLAIASLLLTVLVGITAIGAQTTTAQLARNRFYFNGTTADMKVVRNFLPQDTIEDGISIPPTGGGLL